MSPHSLPVPLLVSLAAALSVGCGGENSPPAPLVQALFPGPLALVSGGATVVRGTATAEASHSITSLRIEGQQAQSTDGYLTWTVSLPLSWSGLRLIDVDVELDARHRYQMPLSVLLQPVTWVGEVRALAAGPDDSLLATSVLPPALVRFDGVDTRSVIASETVGSGPVLAAPSAVALSADPRYAYVADGTTLLAVELSSGDRGVVSDPATHSGATIVEYSAMVLDPTGRFLLVLDRSAAAVYAVDLVSGARALVADASRGVGPALLGAADLAFDPAGNAYVAVADAVLAINLNTGDRTEVSGGLRGQGAALEDAALVAFRASGTPADALLVADRGTAQLVAIDLASGDRADVAPMSLTAPRGMVPHASLTTVTLGQANAADVLHLVDLGSRLATSIQRPALGSGPSLAATLGGLGVEPSMRTLSGTLSAPDIWFLRDGEVIGVDRTTGIRTSVFAGARTGYEVFALDRGPQAPSGTAASQTVPNMPIAAVSRGATLYSLELISGRETELFELNDSIRAVATAQDGVGTLVAVSEDDSGNGDTLAVRVPITGDVVTWPLPDQRYGPVGLWGSRFLALTFELPAPGSPQLVATDLASGMAIMVSGSGLGSGPAFDAPSAIAIDDAALRVIVLDRGRLLAVQSNGDRTLLSGDVGAAAIGAGPPMLDARGLAIDPGRNVAYLIDPVRQALLVVDLTNGDRAVVAR